MNKNTSVNLGEHLTGFVEDQIGRCPYSNASEVMRAGLRLLEEQEARLAALRAALIKAEQSGVSIRDVRGIWSAVSEEHNGADG